MQPFYFTVVFWGEVHRRYFLDLLLASLLSPNNIPALNSARKSKFLIVTTRDDWDALQSEPLFRQMKRYVEPVWFEMPFPRGNELKMLVMSQGHKQVTMRAFADRAYGIFVTPDLVLSDGSVAALERLAEAGKKVVLSVAIRFAQEALMAEMEREGYFKPGQPLVLPARDLMRMALQHLHTETLRYEFDAPYFADMPISVYWWVPEGHGMTIYSFSWAPLLVDYAVLGDHDASTFDEWTMDGDYIHRNFPNPNDVYVCRDSDELVLVSFTKEADLHFDLAVDPRRRRLNRFAVPAKAQRIRDLKDSSIMDSLKRSIFPQPVYLHSADITPAWHEWRKHTDDIIATAYHRRDLTRHLEGQFVSDLYTYSGTGQSRFSDWVIDRFHDESSPKKFLWWLLILFWLLVRPIRYVVVRIIHVYSLLYWYWRYRRFVWWRLKEILGVVEERHFDWRTSGWDAPGVSLVCPIFTIRWLWRYRRFTWWWVKGKLGLVKAQEFHGPSPGWEGPGVSLVCPVFTIRWLWRHRGSLVKEFKPGGAGIRGISHLLMAGVPKSAPEIESVSNGSRSYPAESFNRTYRRGIISDAVMLFHTVKQRVPPKRVVILGATGVIGKALVSYLKDRGEIVVEIGSRDLDLLKDDAPERLAGRLLSDDAVVVLAGIPLRRGRDQAAMAKNVQMGKHIFAALTRRPVAHVLYMSSDAVYPRSMEDVSESTPTAPSDPYSAMHLERERLFLGIAHCPVAMLRSTQVCAPHDTHDAYGPSRFIRTARQENRIVLFGQGEETRDHIMVEDVAAVIHGCLLHRSRGVLNVATGRSLSFAEVARLVADQCDPKPTIEYAPRQMPITHRRFDASAVGLAFPGFSFTTIEDGLANMMRQTIAAKSC